MLEVGCLEACVFNKSKIQVVHWCKPYTTYGIDTSHCSLKFHNMNKIQSNFLQSIMVVLASQIAKEKKKDGMTLANHILFGKLLAINFCLDVFYTSKRVSRIYPPWSSCKWIRVEKLRNYLCSILAWNDQPDDDANFTMSFGMHHTKPFVIHVCWL